MSLLDYQRDVYSQSGEDGVIEELLRRLDIRNGWFCEFGAADGEFVSNTKRLAEQGWRGVMIEGDPSLYEQLTETVRRYDGRVTAIKRYVRADGPDALDEILASTELPVEFDVLSIDVDGPDLLIWESFRNYRPAIVIIEADVLYPPPVDHVHTEDEPGSSFTATARVGREKGYALACHTGNLIFVRDDLAAAASVDADAPSEEFFNWKRRNEEIAYRKTLRPGLREKLRIRTRARTILRRWR